ncbi:hypothetical protein [Kocuria flava]|uniref:NERD domain-containing protein n=1 Tax=Kocuria flava TaxID=446860 RepID=A0ABQ0X7X2_9MICC|nr:hypothetical protein [Kocuria flava]GEO93582.1 hypothetical protein KFL01_28880 [Kocuria flava]
MVEITADDLARALEGAASSFAPGELAYLALTSKVELPLRDRLAWSLYTSRPDLVIAREWHRKGKRIDLALLNRGATPIALVEAKALYSFDVVTPDRANVRKYTRMVEADMAKAFKLLDGHSAPVFALVLITHPMGVPPDLGGVIKYRPGIETALTRATQGDIRTGAWATLSSALEPMGPAVYGSLMAGKAFGVEVIVDYWIVGPTVDRRGEHVSASLTGNRIDGQSRGIRNLTAGDSP